MTTCLHLRAQMRRESCWQPQPAAARRTAVVEDCEELPRTVTIAAAGSSSSCTPTVAVGKVRRRSRARGTAARCRRPSTRLRSASSVTTPDIVGLEPGFRPGQRPPRVVRGARELLGELLAQAPSVAAALSARYPLVICDEHQDASQAQHNAVAALAEAGARSRLLGDPLQAIFEDSSTQGWEATTSWASLGGELTVPRRWSDAPELGELAPPGPVQVQRRNG